ncbi:DUF4089 domain-containing protein [Azospirillum sp. TSO22-1]|uniref:DUF4089 domain-containing protein n=1 Tax=Azospirillum sp. TSO22-1 TaxID=716789 RepID=UPI000D6165A7|nr:DUF4089 domain-containing protein [Azospirillum sp. TSO22-1]PWC53977.1 hypothetical protein TSO221_09680 [Azospirillum sp. TSO22-1]
MTAFDPDKHIDALAPALGLEIRPEWRAGVAGFLTVAAAMADLVEAAVDDSMAEGAAVYRPGEVTK